MTNLQVTSTGSDQAGIETSAYLTLIFKQVLCAMSNMNQKNGRRMMQLGISHAYSRGSIARNSDQTSR